MPTTFEPHKDATFKSLAALVIGSCLMLLCAAGQDCPPLPLGYAYPQLPSVMLPEPLFGPASRNPSLADDSSRLRFYYKDYVGFRLNLDTYAPYGVTWELLSFEHGFKQPWLGPQFAARLYQQTSDEIRLVTRAQLVVFRKVTDAEGQATLVCKSAGDWSIRREGERVVVDGPTRWFAFDTPDFGQTWRLIETGARDLPLTVKLHYTGPIDSLPSALEYPDGKQATIEPAPGLEAIGKLKLPNGMAYRIEYDPGGFPRILEEYALSKEPPQKELNGFVIESKGGQVTQTVTYKEDKAERLVLTRRWIWENDDQGRIRRMVEPCGRELGVEFAKTEDERGEEQLAVVTDQGTGAYRFTRHLTHGGTWTIERGHGAADQPLAEAGYDQRTVQKTMNHQMKVVEFSSAGSPNITRVEYDKQFQETARTCTTPDGKVVWHHETQAMRAQLTPEWYREGGQVRQLSLPGQPAIVYGYDSRGLLASATQHDQKHRYEVDDLGRLRLHVWPDGRRESWTYTPTGLVETHTVQRPAGNDDQTLTPQSPTTYRYDDHRHLIAVERDGVVVDSYRHSCDGPTRWQHGTTELTRYLYEEHRLVRCQQSTRTAPADGPVRETVTRYRYQDDGRLKATQRTESGGEPQTVWYSYTPEGLRTIARTDGPIPPALLDQPVYSFGFSTPTGGVSARYNAFGALLQTNQPPASH